MKSSVEMRCKKCGLLSHSKKGLTAHEEVCPRNPDRKCCESCQLFINDDFPLKDGSLRTLVVCANNQDITEGLRSNCPDHMEAEYGSTDLKIKPNLNGYDRRIFERLYAKKFG